MDVFTSAAELLRNHRPERPVLCLRPHAAARAARWFLANFPGQVLYAAKANDASPIIEALAEAGITKFDVASSVEIARMAAVPNAELYFMNPVKSRVSIRTAFDEFGVRSFAFDSEDELDKILEETGRARDLALYLRIACPNTHSLIPLEGKFGVPMAEAPALLLRARQVAKRLGITFHVGSQAVVPAAFGEALRQVGQLIVTSGVLVDAIDIGGGLIATTFCGLTRGGGVTSSRNSGLTSSGSGGGGGAIISSGGGVGSCSGSSVASTVVSFCERSIGGGSRLWPTATAVRWMRTAPASAAQTCHRGAGR